MSGPIIKRGYFDCEALRAWHKRQHCASPDCDRAADDPHHFPTRGAGGDDLGIIPLCRPCHRRAHAGKPPFTREWQTRAANAALVSFLRGATAAERQEFVAAWEVLAAARVYTEIAS